MVSSEDNGSGEVARHNTAQTLARGLRVLSCFRDQSEMSVSEVAAAAGLGRQITQRLVNTLVEEGYLIRDERTSRYRLGLETIRLSRQALGGINLRTLAMPYMADLARTSGMTVNLNVLDEHNMTVLCVESVDGGDRIRYNMHPGSYGALHVGASRKIILAYLPQSEIDRVLDRVHSLNQDGRETLKKELAVFRSQGWAVTQGESQARAIGCAVPLFGPGGRPAGSLSALGQVSQIGEAKVHAVIDDLVMVARQINDRSVGWPIGGGPSEDVE